MLVKARRTELDALGARLGTPVVYLKAAWSDPVLYGGHGQRRGADLDVLVDPCRFDAFVEALIDQRWRLYSERRHRVSIAASRARTLYPPGAGLALDLHRALSDPPWNVIDTRGLLQRARAWPGCDGPILSLSPEDQVVHAVAHAVANAFAIDQRHPGDIVAMAQTVPIDWPATLDRLAAAGLRLGYELLASWWRAHGLDAPIAPWAGRSELRARLAMARQFITTGHTLDRVRLSPRTEMLVLRPLLADDPTALARFVAMRGRFQLFDRLALLGESKLG
ncbi:MAG: nucleotidyltransferase family protein [Myxococcales bacterium]|nr:nucleotidyltransferase family protein [Myxococcales bacterium]